MSSKKLLAAAVLAATATAAPASAQSTFSCTPACTESGPSAAAVTTTLGDYTVPGLPGAPALPLPALPTGLDALAVPLTPALQLLGLPSVLTVDALPAAQKLVRERVLPAVDLLHLDGLTSTILGSCRSGLPLLSGLSDVRGLRVLGQPVDGPGAVQLLGAGKVPLSAIRPEDLVLPGGVSLAGPAGALLRPLLQGVLDGLPDVDLPAVLGDVDVVRGEQLRDGDGLVQRALRVSVSLLGKTLGDFVLGQTRMSAACASALPAVAPAAGPEVDTVAPASQLAVQCTQRKVTLVNVVPRSDHVSLLGAADRSLVGRTVRIVFTATGRTVASAVVRPDGFFRAGAPLPKRSLRGSNRARYQAVIDGQHSMALKLARRMHISSIKHRGSRVLIAGKVRGTMAGEHPEVVIRRRVSCTDDVVVERVRPGADGTWHASVAAPRDAQAAVYRATTEVVREGATKAFPTFTLPGYISL